jgi:8-oxo-dGTP diphosphatase
MGEDAEKPVVLVAACALVDAEGRVLITKRPEGKPLAGLWEFPGGKVERNETPEHALIRELKEELGVTVTADDLVPLTFASHTYETFHLLMPIYVCAHWHGALIAHEGQELAWVRPDELSGYAMPPADEPLKETLPRLLCLLRTSVSGG